ncbi:hypothetical protein [Sphingomonas sp.]|uniref:hypothetical protein n=1 Tax=Sphingomonas sp. TaxID=28214 RepID=UPI00375266FA
MIALLLAAASVYATAPARGPISFVPNGRVHGEARVMVRIIEGARVHFDRSRPSESGLFHRASVRIDGQIQPAQLVEFP